VNAQRLADIESPRWQNRRRIIRSRTRMETLPFGPQPVYVCVVTPKYGVECGNPRVNHISVLRILAILRIRLRIVIRISTTGVIMNQVVDVFQCAEEMVVGRAASKGKKLSSCRIRSTSSGVGYASKISSLSP